MRRKISQKISNYTFVGQNYKDEFRKQMRMIITFTLGFTIAFAWRETIFDWSKSAAAWITHSRDGGSTLGATMFITIFSILLLFLTSRWLGERSSYKSNFS
jgi:cation transport ATPase